MPEFSGWIVAVLIAAVAILARCVEKGRSRRLMGSIRPPKNLIVEAQRAAALRATQANVEEIDAALQGDDPEGLIASRANSARSDR